MRAALRLALPAVLVALVATACNSNSGTSGTIPAAAAGAGRTASAASTPDVNLRSAASFAILAGATVTSTGQSDITGDVGIFPGSAMTGFPPGIIHGRLRVAGPIAQQAELDLKAAYNDVASRSQNPVTVSGNLGGQTLAPGLYKSTSSLAVSSGDLTLDGHGNRNAVFVFAMGSSFTMTTGRRVIMTNGAKARNVFWAVGSSATFGTKCSFHGNLLVYQSISLGTGSVVNGRMLAEHGAVTMEGNTIVRPAL
ncbi:MAG TPA: ice-binding family protein [Candidatus Acidoferrales bacterium]|nr:ice-binding family protein [Candidatus Acidoferrales bacterium]